MLLGLVSLVSPFAFQGVGFILRLPPCMDTSWLLAQMGVSSFLLQTQKKRNFHPWVPSLERGRVLPRGSQRTLLDASLAQTGSCAFPEPMTR